MINLLMQRRDELRREREGSWVFKPRNYQKRLIAKYEEGVRFFMICWARRLGKDMMAFGIACKQCLDTPNSIVYYVFPTMKQGKMMILDGYTNDKQSIITTVIDKGCLKLPEKSGRLYHHDNTLQFKNGSIIYFVGAQDANSKVGGNLDLLVISEAGLIKNPDIITYLIPSVINVGGKIILVSTPRFGSTFNDMLDNIDTTWHRDVLKATEAYDDRGDRVHSDEKLEIAKSLMSMTKFLQEYMCDTAVANEESIYAKSLSLAEKVKEVPRNKRINISFDLGINDSTACVIAVGETVVHHYQNVDQPTQHYIDYVESFLAKNKILKSNVTIVLPHDANNRHDAITHLTSRRKAWVNLGYKTIIIPQQRVNKAIEICRHSIEQKKLKFLDIINVNEMVKLMKKYEWRIDSTTGENLRTPVHGRRLSASNTCDAVEYLCIHLFKDEYESNIAKHEWGNYLE